MKKKLLSLVTALLTAFSMLSMTAFAEYVPVFDEAQEKSAEDEALEALYEEMLAAELSRNYYFQCIAIDDMQLYAEQHGFEPLPISYFDNYSLAEILDIYADIYEQLMKLDRSKLADSNKYQYDFLKNYIETQEMLRGVDEDFFTAFDQTNGMYKFFDLPVYRLYFSAEDVEDTLDVMETFGDYADMICEKELRRLDKGLALTKPQLGSTINECITKWSIC